MINPLATFIQYLKAQAAAGNLSTRQIAERIRYTGSWKIGSRSVVARLDGGTPNVDIPVQAVRVEVRCFAESPFEASELLNELITLSRTANREPVTVGSDTAVLYGFQQSSGPSQLFDDNVKMDFALMFFEVQVAE
jgi:spore coat protein U-like protein